MGLKKRFFFTLIFILAVIPSQLVFAASSIPPGFRLIASAQGVELYRKNYKGGSPDYVQVIDFRQGAAVKLLHGKIKEPREDKGVYGNADPRMGFKSIKQYWNEFSSQNSTAFCVTNGEFFYMPENPTRLAFPLKKDGVIVTDGFGSQTYVGHHMMLELWPDRADITPLTPEALNASTAPNIVSGLSEEANKRAKKYVGRTFVGIDDQDQDGSFETVLIINTQSARQVDVAGVLRSFGADKVMMLDGGGSAQLYCQGTAFVYSERLLPQALAVMAGFTQQYSAALIDLPVNPTLNQGESLALQVQAVNTGNAAWRAGEVQLVIEKAPWAENESLPLAVDVAPGENVAFSWEAAPFTQPGDYPAQVYLVRGGETVSGPAQQINISVLPQEIATEAPVPEAASLQPEAGTSQPEAGTSQPEAGTSQPEAETTLPEAESQQPPPEEPQPDIEQQTETPLSLFQGLINPPAEEQPEEQSQAPEEVEAGLQQAQETQQAQLAAVLDSKPRFADVIWIPLVISPIVAVLVKTITSRQRRTHHVDYYHQREYPW